VEPYITSAFPALSTPQKQRRSNGPQTRALRSQPHKSPATWHKNVDSSKDVETANANAVETRKKVETSSRDACPYVLSIQPQLEKIPKTPAHNWQRRLPKY